MPARFSRACMTGSSRIQVTWWYAAPLGPGWQGMCPLLPSFTLLLLSAAECLAAATGPSDPASLFGAAVGRSFACTSLLGGGAEMSTGADVPQAAGLRSTPVMFGEHGCGFMAAELTMLPRSQPRVLPSLIRLASRDSRALCVTNMLNGCPRSILMSFSRQL
jgi:hypothetical protein